MFGRLRMSVQQAIDCYSDFSREIFGKPKRTAGDGKYSATTFVKVVRDIVEKRTGNSETSLWDDNVLGGTCKM
jgi:hypothetical protein